MHHLLNKLNKFLVEEFVFARRYHIWRHIIYWSFHITVWSVFWLIMGAPVSFARMFFNMMLWIPVFIFFGYPLAYIAVPRLLLKAKVWQFSLLVLLWAVIGLFINAGYRTYVFVPIEEFIGFTSIPAKGLKSYSYLCMTTSAASPMIIRFFKLWTIRQRAWLHAKQEQVITEVQLLKAEVHPQFLLNTLDNIYSFSFERSPETPGLILKLSSLLSYMLYDCKNDEVRLENEIETMKNYIDLERERYRDKIDISVNIEGDMRNKYITPLLLLPFLENAFKHGMSKLAEEAWISVDIAVKNAKLTCKVVNSKQESVSMHENGVGISNVKRRLEFLYPGKHDLKLADEGDFFVVSLLLDLKSIPAAPVATIFPKHIPNKPLYEIAVPFNR